MRRILARALEHGYTPYTSTLEEAWRASIEGLSTALSEAWASDREPRAPRAEAGPAKAEDAFAILEARRHRERGIPLAMFLGLFKHYRDTYLDLIEAEGGGDAAAERFTATFFDRIEVAFCSEWARESGDGKQAELRDANRRLANEKNLYLTIFESLPGPALFVGADGQAANMNWAAAELLLGEQSPGAAYYGGALDNHFPWVSEVVRAMLASRDRVWIEERDLRTTRGPARFRLTGRRMLDVSRKYAGALILLEDVTVRAALEDRVQALQRLASTPSLARDLAHELNNPLACVVSNLEMLDVDQRAFAARLAPREQAECREALEGAREGAERIRALVADLERILREQRVAGPLAPQP